MRASRRGDASYSHSAAEQELADAQKYGFTLVARVSKPLRAPWSELPRPRMIGPDTVTNCLEVRTAISLFALGTVLFLYEKEKLNIRYCHLKIALQFFLIQEAPADKASSCSANGR
jgi:hypothetical protein